MPPCGASRPAGAGRPRRPGDGHVRAGRLREPSRRRGRRRDPPNGGAGGATIVSRPVRIGVSLAAVGVALVVLILSAPQNAGSGGFVALHRFLPVMGIQVQESERPPSAGTFLLLADDRNETEEN